jgi:hypothetical protein
MEVAPMSEDLSRQTFACYVGVRHLQPLPEIDGRAEEPAAGKLSSD